MQHDGRPYGKRDGSETAIFVSRFEATHAGPSQRRAAIGPSAIFSDHRLGTALHSPVTTTGTTSSKTHPACRLISDHPPV